MRKFIKDDTGIAYGLFIIACFLLLAGVLYIAFLPTSNRFITVFNIFIDQDMVSQDTSDAFEFNTVVIAALPLFMVMGMALWGIVRALEKRNMGG